MDHFPFFSIIALCLSAQGCQSNAKEAAPASEVEADTLAPVELLNPDTAFASTENLDVKIVVYDSIHSAQVSSFANLYADQPGIFTFRGNPERTGTIFHLEHQPDSLCVEWTFSTSIDNRKTSHGSWGGGTGWTGQPLYIEWPDSLASLFKAAGTMSADAGNREVIFASLCSKLYFVDYATGLPSREPIHVSHPIKGTPMLDPLRKNLIYVGHGVQACSDPWGQIVVDLHRHEVTQRFGRDGKAWRGWGAYDSSPLRFGDFIFRPGENGTLYKWLLEGDRTTLHSTMQYRVKGIQAPGVESSMSVWRNYGYLNDNHGNVLCVNLNTLHPVWRYNNHDDGDCTPIVSHEDDGTYIYVGCELDRHPSDSVCRFVKLNALTGQLVWENTARSRKVNSGGKHFDGGYYASPLLGAGPCSDLVFINRVLNLKGQNGELVAIDKATGEDRYTVSLRHYAWSSPIGFISDDGKFTIFTADTAGNVYLIDGATGTLLHRQHVGSNFESSPIAVGNTILLGSRGNKFYKLRLL